MKPAVSDLRYLKVAELYERACSRFVRELASQASQDARIQTALSSLAPDLNERAERVATEIARLSAPLRPEDAHETIRAVLLGVIDLERAARRFYILTIDRVHDPSVLQLFRSLASQIDEHEKITERIIGVHYADHHE